MIRGDRNAAVVTTAALLFLALIALPAQALADSMLYAPAESDDPTYRQLISQQIGGPCDYFDARLGTPSPELLASYDCVHTWSRDPYNSPIEFGDRLADFVDGGGRVILGAHTSSQGGSLILGRITQSGYLPVTSLGASDQQSAWDGTCREDCVWTNIPGVYASHRAIGTMADPVHATVCGRYVDGEVAVAFNSDRSVAFVNGAAAFPYPLDPYMAQLVGNVCLCEATSDPEGACCLEDGSCVVLNADDCDFEGGTYLGDGTLCDPDPCSHEKTGACCLSNGICIVVTASQCLESRGTYFGDGSLCKPDPCDDDPLGACCAPGQPCLVTTPDECAALEGEYQGADVPCDPDPCPEIAACCLKDGSCILLTADECTARGGSFQTGVDTCDPNPCPPVPIQNVSWGTLKWSWH